MTKRELAMINAEFEWLQCKDCYNEVKVIASTKSVLCGTCTTKLAPPEDRLLKTQEKLKKEKSKFTKGWAFYKYYVLEDGTVFEKGKENPKLKGTMEPTKIKTVKRKSKKSSIYQKNVAEQKEMERLAKRYKKSKKAKRRANK